MKLLFARVSNPVRPDLCNPVEVFGASTVREVLKNRYGENFIEFPRATVVIVNDKYVMRADWDAPLRNGDVVIEHPLVAGVETLIGILIVAVVVLIAATIKIPKVPGVNAGQGLGEPPSVYSLAGQRNQSRLNFPIEVAYGRNRMFPAYAAPWYNRYEHNNQYLYALFCLGQGEFDIHDFYIEDTPATSISGMTVRALPPGFTPSVVWPRVLTSVEAANIELVAPNELNYPGGMVQADPLPEVEGDPAGALPPESGWFGPFALNPWGTSAWQVEVDLTLPGGCFGTDKDTGEPYALKIAVEFQRRAINADGTFGEWVGLFALFYEPTENEPEFYSDETQMSVPPPVVIDTEILGTLVFGSYEGAERPTPFNMPRRMTLVASVPDGRWQIRGRRMNKKVTDSGAVHTVQWEAVRTYLRTDISAFGDVTMLEVKIRATNGVNNGASNRVNCIATRKIPQLVETTETTPVGEPIEFDDGVWVNGTPDIGQTPFDSMGGMPNAPIVPLVPDSTARFASLPMPTFAAGTQLTFNFSFSTSGAAWADCTGFFYFMDADGVLLPADGEAYMPVTLLLGNTAASGAYTRMVPFGAAGVAFMLNVTPGMFDPGITESLLMSASPIWQQLTVTTTEIGFTETKAATTSPIDAFCDIVRNTKYGANLSDDFLDVQSLFALKTRLAEVPYAFNYVYDQKTTVWDALSVVAQACRCMPTLHGSLITMVRDELTTIPLAVFTPHNIVKGSFSLQTKLAAIDEYDGLLVQYLDETSWSQETVLCKAKNASLVEIEAGLNPDNTRLAGVTTRAQAYKEGLYQRQATRLMRSTVNFNTGLEGYIPAIGDMISVTMDVPKWGQSGFVLQFVSSTVFLLKERLAYTGSLSEYRVLFRTKVGAAVGPETISAEAQQIDGTWRYTLAASIDLELVESEYGNTDPVVFLLGLATGNQWSKLCKILSLTPNDDDTVGINAYVYNPDVFNGTEPGDPVPPQEPAYPGTPPPDWGGPVPPSPAPDPSNDYQFKLDERPMATEEPCEVDSPWKAFTTWKEWTYDVLSSTYPVVQIEVRKLEDEGYDDYFIVPGGDSPLGYPFIVGKFQMRIRYVHCAETTIPGEPIPEFALIQIRQNPA